MAVTYSHDLSRVYTPNNMSNQGEYTYSYFIKTIYRCAENPIDHTIMWSKSGREIILFTPQGSDHGHVKQLSYQIMKYKLQRFGFEEVYEDSKATVMRHEFFKRGREDLLFYFTQRREYCYAKNIVLDDREILIDNDSKKKLLLKLYDLGRVLNRADAALKVTNVKIGKIRQITNKSEILSCLNTDIDSYLSNTK